jgi:uncharacterized protein YdhG (YjbR/CyaY superfamily)
MKKSTYRSKRIPATTVKEYLEIQPEEVRVTLEKVRKAIKAAAPKAEEVISYQIPTYKLNGPVAAFAAFPNHCSFFTTSHAVMKDFKDELKDYDTSGVTIHFPAGKPLPGNLIKKLVIAKIKENEIRIIKKKSKT